MPIFWRPSKRTENFGYARTIFKALSHDGRIGHARETNDVLIHEKRMTLTKEKNNTHKTRTLPNDERPFKGPKGLTKGLETDINGCQKMTFISHAFSYAALV